MFFGMLLVDAALAAWAVGIYGRPNGPKWVRFVIVWLGVTLVVSVAGVAVYTDHADNALAGFAGRIGPAGAVVGAIALLFAQMNGRLRKGK